jgi:hypothetical protein
MSNTTIKLKNSGVTGNIPVDLEHGELALNYADSRIYYKNSDGVITYVSTSGGGSDSFATINVQNSLIVATSNTDILSFASANNISLKANSVSKTITIDGSQLTNLIGGAFSGANAANVLAQSAFNKANTNADEIVVLHGIDNAQNTLISSIVSFAQSIDANVNALFGIDADQNTRIDSVNTFTQAAYNEANNAYTRANTVESHLAANVIYIQSVNNTQNTNIGNVNTFTQSAYDTANVGSNFVNFGGTITGNVSVTGNVSAQIVLTDNIYHANGVPWSMNGGGGTTANSFVLYNFPLGDYGSVTDPMLNSFGELIIPNYDMKSDPLLLGLVSLDLGTVP